MQPLGVAGRVAVIGDVAGHLDELTTELVRLGADPTTLVLPADLTVIQVGDLIHRGPDSDGVIALVDRYLTEQSDCWVQLVGNHEAQYLRAPVFEWPEAISDDSAGTLMDWWTSHRMRCAVAISSDDESFVVTHAGVTEGFWEQALDLLPTAEQVAGAINSFIGHHDDVVFHAGEMLGGGRPNFTAGPVWASAAQELVPSWLDGGHPLPFSQVHGHSMVVDWRRNKLNSSRAVAKVMTLDTAAAHETATLPGGRIVGVDPGHGRTPHHPWRAFELTGTVLI
jgi:hypothetical protein